MSLRGEHSDEPVPVVTIDGPSGSGKGAVSRQLARHLGWHYLDSGVLYRLLACAALEDSISLDDAAALVGLAGRLRTTCVLPLLDTPVVMLAGVDVADSLRTEDAGNAASRIAALPAVREALLAWQRDYRRSPGLVADGRDMGTVVFPDAQLKVFLTARPDVRAGRRYNQLKDMNKKVDRGEMVSAVEARDQRDASRRAAPMVPAADAMIVDNSDLDEATTLAKVLEAVQKIL
ncbi:MAG: (d)CMP kinase [Gammaproteobacteria bacterium]